MRHLNLRDASLRDIAEANARVLVLEWDSRHPEGSAECLIVNTIRAVLLTVDVENVRRVHLGQFLPGVIKSEQFPP